MSVHVHSSIHRLNFNLVTDTHTNRENVQEQRNALGQTITKEKECTGTDTPQGRNVLNDVHLMSVTLRMDPFLAFSMGIILRFG